VKISEKPKLHNLAESPLWFGKKKKNVLIFILVIIFGKSRSPAVAGGFYIVLFLLLSPARIPLFFIKKTI
jgi:hypothetical protein